MTLSAASDFIAHGQITTQTRIGEATIRGKGESQFRMDMEIDGETESLAVNNGNGQFKSAHFNKTGAIPSYNARAMESLTIPCLRTASAFLDPNVEVLDEGLQPANGVSLHKIRVIRHFSKRDDPNDALAALRTADYYINPDFTIARIDDSLRPNRAGIGLTSRGQVSILTIPRTLHFSNYRTVNGISVPFSVSEDVAQQHVWTLEVGDISFNTGQGDSDFTLR